MNQDTVVAVVVTRPETVLADYARLLDLAGVTAPVARETQVWSLAPAPPPRRFGPAAACPPWQLEGVVRALLAAGQRPEDITLAIPPGLDPAREPLCSWRRVLRGCDLDPSPLAAGEAPTPASRLILTNLHTHRRLGLAGAVAAQAATLVAAEPSVRLDAQDALETAWRREAAWLGGAVIDATVVGDGLHESVLVPVAAHVLLAGHDPVAVDAVACRLAGLDPWRVPLLARLARAGLGRLDRDAIVLLGDTAAMPASLNLSSTRRWRAGRGASAPSWWRRWSTELQDRWPRPLARRRARRRYESQPWGRLHAEYDRRGTIGGGQR